MPRLLRAQANAAIRGAPEYTIVRLDFNDGTGAALPRLHGPKLANLDPHASELTMSKQAMEEPSDQELEEIYGKVGPDGTLANRKGVLENLKAYIKHWEVRELVVARKDYGLGLFVARGKSVDDIWRYEIMKPELLTMHDVKDKLLSIAWIICEIEGFEAVFDAGFRAVIGDNELARANRRISELSDENEELKAALGASVLEGLAHGY